MIILKQNPAYELLHSIQRAFSSKMKMPFEYYLSIYYFFVGSGVGVADCASGLISSFAVGLLLACFFNSS